MKYLNAAISLSPSDPRYYSYKGHVLNNMQSFSLAVQAYERAIQLATRTKNAPVDILSTWYSELADTYINMKRNEDAAMQYTHVLKLYANDVSKLNEKMLAGWMHAKINIADWSNYNTIFKRLHALVTCTCTHTHTHTNAAF